MTIEDSATPPLRHGTHTAIGVLGATGFVGKQICAELIARCDRPIVAIARNASRLAQLSGELGAHVTTCVADAHDPRALAQALAPLGLIINAAGPFVPHGARIARAAVDAGIAYIDVASEQTHVRDLVERVDAPARRAGVTVVPAAGMTSALADWGATLAVEALRLRGVTAPLDALESLYAYEQWRLSTGSQAALFAALGASGVRWFKDRWRPARFAFAVSHVPGDVTAALGAAPPPGGNPSPRIAVWQPSPDIIVLSRRHHAQRVDSYVSPTGAAHAHAWLRSAGWAMALLPGRGIASVLAPFVADESTLDQATFAVQVTATAHDHTAVVRWHGAHLYAATAKLAAATALQVLSDNFARLGAANQGGVRSVDEVWPVAQALPVLRERDLVQIAPTRITAPAR